MGDEPSMKATLTEVVRVSVHLLAEHVRADTPHPVPGVGADAVTAARVRERVDGCLARIADEVCGAGVGEAIVAARAVRPQEASWARLGARLGVTGQAVSKRAGVRRLAQEKATPDEAERAELARQRHYRWLSTHTHTPPAPPPREPAVPAPAVLRDDALSPARLAAELGLRHSPLKSSRWTRRSRLSEPSRGRLWWTEAMHQNSGSMSAVVHRSSGSLGIAEK